MRRENQAPKSRLTRSRSARLTKQRDVLGNIPSALDRAKADELSLEANLTATEEEAKTKVAEETKRNAAEEARMKAAEGEVKFMQAEEAKKKATEEAKWKAAEKYAETKPDEEAIKIKAPEDDKTAWKTAIEEETAKKKVEEEEEEAASLDCCNPQQKQQNSYLSKLKIMNLQEARDQFFASGFKKAPKFSYGEAIDKESKKIRSNTNVSFHLLPHANRILARAEQFYGGPESLTQSLYGEDYCSADTVRKAAVDYLRRESLDDIVDVHVVDSMLSAAHIGKISCENKYILSLCPHKISSNMLAGLFDHEIGTHLLRMMNDQEQAWHGCKARYQLADSCQVETTEEGLATLNTYQTLPSKLLHEHALRYYAVCYGAKHGFVELFNCLRKFMTDVERCWQLCCRVKRGLIDTSLPGSLWRDQSYFQGAVEILDYFLTAPIRMQQPQFGKLMKLLYSGRLAVKDLSVAALVADLKTLRMPHFLCNSRVVKAYEKYLNDVARENLLGEANMRITKPIGGCSTNTPASVRAASHSPSTRDKHVVRRKQPQRQTRTQTPPQRQTRTQTPPQRQTRTQTPLRKSKAGERSPRAAASPYSDKHVPCTSSEQQLQTTPIHEQFTCSTTISETKEEKQGQTCSLVLSPLTTPSSSPRDQTHSLQAGAEGASDHAIGMVHAQQNSDSNQPLGHASKTPHVMVSECYDCNPDEPEGNGSNRFRQLCNSMRGILRISACRRCSAIADTE